MKLIKNKEGKSVVGNRLLVCVSIGLYEYLIENGIKADDFKPIYKSDYLQAYAFAPEKEYNIRSSAYDYHKCSTCGREYTYGSINRKNNSK